MPRVQGFLPFYIVPFYLQDLFVCTSVIYVLGLSCRSLFLAIWKLLYNAGVCAPVLNPSTVRNAGVCVHSTAVRHVRGRQVAPGSLVYHRPAAAGPDRPTAVRPLRPALPHLRPRQRHDSIHADCCAGFPPLPPAVPVRCAPLYQKMPIC
jgi:hypothetical protein